MPATVGLKADTTYCARHGLPEGGPYVTVPVVVSGFSRTVRYVVSGFSRTVGCVNVGYSWRRASTGLTELARCAGSDAATTPITARRATADPIGSNPDG